MALAAPIYGGNLLQIFDLGSADSFGDLEFAFTHIESTQPKGHPKRQRLSIEIVSKADNEALEQHLGAWLTPNADDARDISLTYEDGTKDIVPAMGVHDDATFGFAYYAGVTGGKRKVYVGVGKYSGDTGSVSYKSGEVAGVAIQITALPVRKAITCAAAKFSTAKVTDATDIEIPVGAPAAIVYFDAAE